MDKNLMHIGAMVAERRKAAGLSQKALAKKAGLRQATVSDLENGNINFKYETIRAIADALNCEIKAT